MAFELTRDDLRDLVRGAALLGTGGGGDPSIGRTLVSEALRDGRSVTIVSPDELDDDDYVVPTAFMGAPSVLVERLPGGTEAIDALRALEAHTGQRATATMPIESGGINSTIPLFVAARHGIPVVDADGMGRAFPELQMETFAVYGVDGPPLAIADERGDTAIVDTGSDNKKMENWARVLTVQMGGVSHIAAYGMRGADIRRTAIPGTLSLALALGRTLREAREQHRDPMGALKDALADTLYERGDVIFTGKVVDVDRRTVEGFTRGRATIAAFDGDASCTIDFQNEFLLAKVDGRTRAIVPDLVTVLHMETGEPITAESLRYGNRVHVFAISTPEMMRTPEALRVFGPSAFGVDEDFVPFEQLPVGSHSSVVPEKEVAE
ncbi:DUF917 domain-containing protein [Haloechinothrix sp. YIM 98757]|uniref:DUF917 domain-containing protein n=1 Tax=Haloechinothrix aidingensis TaxID=2752311 RepID=A0A838ADB2_9PSEU|nr:DUF917 domain-containing protein [Haloechinothrix aidingensis]MBA0127191.1 DUF917 domain-containing protein [Haloechinothrix aidingensis]